MDPFQACPCCLYLLRELTESTKFCAVEVHVSDAKVLHISLYVRNNLYLLRCRLTALPRVDLS